MAHQAAPKKENSVKKPKVCLFPRISPELCLLDSSRRSSSFTHGSDAKDDCRIVRNQVHSNLRSYWSTESWHWKCENWEESGKCYRSREANNCWEREEGDVEKERRGVHGHSEVPRAGQRVHQDWDEPWDSKRHGHPWSPSRLVQRHPGGYHHGSS